MSIPARVGNTSCVWAKWPGQGQRQSYGHGCLAFSNPDRETKPQRLAAFPHPPRAHFPSPFCRVAEHIICKPQDWYYRNTFSLSEGHTLWLIAGLHGEAGKMPRRSTCHYCWENKAIGEVARFPQITPPPHIRLYCQQCLAVGHSTGTSLNWSPNTHCIPLQGWSLGTKTTRSQGGAHLPREYRTFSTTLQRSEKPEKYKRAKNLVTQHNLLENNG